MDISFIIVNFNTDALTLQAVNSVFEFTSGLECEVIVVDNNSRETRLESLLQAKKNVRFIRLDKNLGFGKANNKALPFCSGKYVFLLNSDAYLIDDGIKRLFSYMEDQNHAEVIICGTNLIDGNHQPNLCHGNYLTEDKLLYDLGFKKNMDPDYLKEINAISKKCDFEKPKEVDYVSGAAMMIRKKSIDQFGLFDPRFHMYYEDMELCYRYHKKGCKIVLHPLVTLVHLGGKSSVSEGLDSPRLAMTVLKSKYFFSLGFLSPTKAYFYYLLNVLSFNYNRMLKTIKRSIIKIIRR
ncbi:glycosyltransferase family 2 protein [Flavobacterium silvisoli]|uniref:Glycosyltransferase family 2 protein n=1 Tax=Flavobacterium silvisoli TaxID=2529433 RepID=A0A4Q9Z214_9FLAO|nr:glycosyltransferase family 2 protein [Flavobacterium silvisoli]TBX69255.1 glycosyltransferase family 2 protein [Flavobacterium silvisoli]